MSERALVIAFVLVASLGCKSKVPSNAAAGTPSAASAPSVAREVPIPPEPPPPQAAKVAEVPALEAELAANKSYGAAWAPDHADDRAVLLTAVSDMISAGTTHTEAEAAVKRANLADAMLVIDKIIWRTGKLPKDLEPKFEAYLSANKQSPELGVWAPEQQGKPLFDASALAMWLHPNDPGYVRARIHALTKGPYRYRADAPMARAWLMNLGDIINRLTALGAFNQRDCEDLNARWTEKVLPDGQKQYGCEPVEKPFVAQEASVVGTWDLVITNTSMPNSVATDSMRHVFRPDHTVTVRMEDKKTPAFKWSFEQGKHFVAYKYGEFDHKREFRLRSADEAEVVESNGNVLDRYVRDGSPLAQGKTPVALFGPLKTPTDPTSLVVGRAYVLERETPLMPDPEPADPVAALSLVKKVPPGATFTILSTRLVSGKPWYAVRTTLGGPVTGWFNSTALAGQALATR